MKNVLSLAAALLVLGTIGLPSFAADKVEAKKEVKETKVAEKAESKKEEAKETKKEEAKEHKHHKKHEAKEAKKDEAKEGEAKKEAK
jgi:Sec-independent protein translocase protein TatA